MKKAIELWDKALSKLHEVKEEVSICSYYDLPKKLSKFCHAKDLIEDLEELYELPWEVHKALMGSVALYDSAIRDIIKERFGENESEN